MVDRRHNLLAAIRKHSHELLIGAERLAELEIHTCTKTFLDVCVTLELMHLKNSYKTLPDIIGE